MEQLKRNVGWLVQLEPIACRLDENDNELDPINDDWVIDEVSTEGLRISNTRTRHTTTLGKDHVHHFTTNPERSRGGGNHGFLTLNIQLFIKGNDLWIRPNSRPGERVSHSPTSPEERLLRASLLDERFRMVQEDYLRRGMPQLMIDTFPDLTGEEKAELFDRVVRWKKGRGPKHNPYRDG